MVHEKVVSNWVYEHYLIYLYLCIADSDCLISDHEIQAIRSRSFPMLHSERCNFLIQEVYQEFWSHSEEERRFYIKENAAKYLRTDIIKNKVIQHLQEMVLSKDEESEEYIMFRFIRKVINNAK
ncbi:MAG: hypothetical protein K2X86_12515 [Cytophagaceae bacterium]|nr:hypothetical protein [Cytophagaceae bacterium]